MATNFVIPPAQEWARTGVTLPTALLRRLSAVLDEVNSERPKPEKLSRDELVLVLLEWALSEHEAQTKKTR